MVILRRQASLSVPRLDMCLNHKTDKNLGEPHRAECKRASPMKPATYLYRKTLITTGLQCLREQSDKQTIEKIELAIEEEPVHENYILCRECHQIITNEEQRIVMHGAHRHTFANPNGIVFDIGCFKTAVGCGYSGHASNEFTWFAGFSWRVAVCSMCLSHLGWLFESTGGTHFHGLILDRLLSVE